VGRTEKNVGHATILPGGGPRHRRHEGFGRGDVVAADAEGVTVDFGGIGKKRLDAAYLRREDGDTAARPAA
jgi:hypothetical protein